MISKVEGGFEIKTQVSETILQAQKKSLKDQVVRLQQQIDLLNIKIQELDDVLKM